MTELIIADIQKRSKGKFGRGNYISGAAANTTEEALDRGLSNKQAYTLGAIAGIAEIVTEKISLETLLDKTAMGKSAWTAFRRRLAGASPRPTGEEEEMTQEKFDMMLEDYLARKRKEPLPGWAKAEFEEAVRMGITDGTEPMGWIPRYQAALMAKRAGKAS